MVEVFRALREELVIRGFSKKTVKAYEYWIERFLRGGVSKREFLLRLVQNSKSPETVRSASAAIDFHTVHVLKRKQEFVPLPKRKKTLPVVLTKEDVKRMIDTTANVKHKLIIELLYSSGLRLSELQNLTVETIDSVNGTLLVRNGKGGKDRMTIISKKLAERVRSLVPAGRVLEGRNGKKYHEKSVQSVIEQATKRAGIRQKVTPHTLRHCFATHLLEQGTDIRYIQELLGHERLQTTQIYTRVAKNALQKIRNPLDS